MYPGFSHIGYMFGLFTFSYAIIMKTDKPNKERNFAYENG